MHNPFRHPQKSIKQIVYELMQKEIEKDNLRRRVNLAVVPMKNVPQGSKVLKKITPKGQVQSTQLKKGSSDHITQNSEGLYNQKQRNKILKLLQITRSKYDSRQEERKKPLIQERHKSYSLNMPKPTRIKLPSLHKETKHFNSISTKQPSLFDNIETLEGYNLEAEDMTLEIDEYVKLKSLNSLKLTLF